MPNLNVEDVDMPPIYAPSSPDYSPSNFSLANRQRVYGEKINSLDHLMCDPVGERSVLIEQLTFRSLNDSRGNKDAVVEGEATCGANGGGGDNESFNGGVNNVSSVAASITSGEGYNAATTCGDGDISSDHENKSTGIIIIPSPTARVYISFVINRRSIPKLCFNCFRSYCVCAKESIDDVTRHYYDSQNYEFFRNADDSVTRGKFMR